MKKLISCSLVVVGLLVNHLAVASGVAYSFAVTEVRVDKDGKGFMTFEKDLRDAYNSKVPLCTTDQYKNTLAFDVNTKGGQAIFALAISAKTSGKLIHGVGTGKCDLYGVMEDWQYGWVK